MRIIVFLFGLCLFVFMNIMPPNLGGTALEMGNNILVWIGVWGILLVGFLRILKTKLLHYDRFFIWSFVFIVVLLIPNFYSTNNSFNFIPGMISVITLGVALYLVLLNEKIKSVSIIPLILWAFSLSSLLQSLIVIFQNVGNSVCIFCNEISPGFKVIGTFQQVNVVATYLMIGVVTSYYIIKRSKFVAFSRLKYSVLGLVIFVNTVIVTMAGSRIGWVSLLIVLMVILFNEFKHYGYKKSFPLLAVFYLAVGAGLFLSTQDYDVKERVTTKLGHNAAARQVIYKHSIDMIMDNPWRGYGYGSFESSYVFYAAERHSVNKDYPPPHGTNLDHPHNEILLLWIEGGVLPIIALAILVVLNFYRLRGRCLEDKILMCLLFVPLLHVLTEYPLRQSVPHFIYLIVILVALSDEKYKTHSFNLNRYIRYALSMISLCIVLFIQFYLVVQFRNTVVFALFTQQPEVFRESYLKTRFYGPHAEKLSMYNNILRFNYAKATPDFEQMKGFIDWAKEAIKTKPRLIIFQTLIEALVIYGQIDEAKEIYKQAIFLYPNEEFLEPM